MLLKRIPFKWKAPFFLLLIPFAILMCIWNKVVGEKVGLLWKTFLVRFEQTCKRIVRYLETEPMAYR